MSKNQKTTVNRAGQWTLWVKIPFMAAMATGFVFLLFWSLLRPQSYFTVATSTYSMPLQGIFLYLLPNNSPAEFRFLPTAYNWWEGIRWTLPLVFLTWIAVAVWIDLASSEEEKTTLLLNKKVWPTVKAIVPLIGFLSGLLGVLAVLALQPRDVGFTAYNPVINRNPNTALVVKLPDEQLMTSPQVREVLETRKLRQQGEVAFMVTGIILFLFGLFVSWYLWGVVFLGLLRARHPDRFALMAEGAVLEAPLEENAVLEESGVPAPV